ncbi:MAG: hypothetical protein FVQ77_08175 [Cytophagales bacterium]|nr:hypothetical protein [Cytophagales bacterium]
MCYSHILIFKIYIKIFNFQKIKRSVTNQSAVHSRLPPSAFRLPTSAFRLPPSAFRLPTSAFRLPTVQLPTADCRLPTAD